jgi:hypothetical protein
LFTRPRVAIVSYVVGLAVAFELSLGFFGLLYPFLYEHLAVFRGFRAPARAGVFVLLFLSLLAAHGAATLAPRVPRRARTTAGILLSALLLLELWAAPLKLEPFFNKAPALYEVLDRLPRGVVAEFPMPRADSPPHHDPRFAYMSTFHWKPLVNGYSGFYPASYLQRLEEVAGFPDERSIARLRRDGVRYVVVHADGYPPGAREQMAERLVRLGVKHVGNFEDGWSVGSIMDLD